MHLQWCGAQEDVNGRKSDSNWVWEHHLKEHKFREIITILKCNPFYELKLLVIENWLNPIWIMEEDWRQV